MSILGIARAIAVSLLVEMPELGRLDQRQVASLAGLAPLARQWNFTLAPHDPGLPRPFVSGAVHAGAGSGPLQPGSES